MSESLGDIFKRAREERGRALADIATDEQRKRDAQVAKDRETAHRVIEGLRERIEIAVRGGHDTLEVMLLGMSHARTICQVQGAGKIVYDHLLEQGLGPHCKLDIDTSGNFHPQDRFLLVDLQP